MNGHNGITLRNGTVREDKFGRWNLNDIWALAKALPNKRPEYWRVLPSTKKLVSELQKRLTSSYLKANTPNTPVIDVEQGTTGDTTWVHPVLAAAYAGHLSPKPEIESRQIWLRYRAGDASLADEILQRASPELNEWAARRAMGRAVRGLYTAELDKRGVTKPVHFAVCTNTTYQGLFDKTASQLKAERGMQRSPRDAMSIAEIAFVAASEALSVERMDHENSQGFRQCQTATAKAASAIRNAIEADRKDRIKGQT